MNTVLTEQDLPVLHGAAARAPTSTTMATATPVTESHTARAPVAEPVRFDLYAGIHKAVRLALSRAMTRIGSADPQDLLELTPVLDEVQGLLDLCRDHLKHENQHVHPLLERARPGMTTRIAQEHVHHEEEIEDLQDLLGHVRRCVPADRSVAAFRLYRQLAVFVGENLLHMEQEETEHNAVLWAAYSDAELMAVESRVIAALSEQQVRTVMPLMVTGMNPAERAALLSQLQVGMREAGAPPEAFAQILREAGQQLSTPQWMKLCRALGLPFVPGLTEAA